MNALDSLVFERDRIPENRMCNWKRLDERYFGVLMKLCSLQQEIAM